MTLYQLRIHSMDLSKRKLDAAEAKHLAGTPKFQAGLDREKKRMAKLRREFRQESTSPAGNTNGTKA